MKKLHGVELEQAQIESAESWQHDAESELIQAELSGGAALIISALGAFALSRGGGEALLAIPAFAISAGCAWLALSEVREAMKLSRIAGGHRPKPEGYKA